MGIVNSFAAMAASGSGGLASISSGVEALITTAFGRRRDSGSVALQLLQIKIETHVRRTPRGDDRHDQERHRHW